MQISSFFDQNSSFFTHVVEVRTVILTILIPQHLHRFLEAYLRLPKMFVSQNRPKHSGTLMDFVAYAFAGFGTGVRVRFATRLSTSLIQLSRECIQYVSEVRKSEFFFPAFRSASFIVTPDGFTLGCIKMDANQSQKQSQKQTKSNRKSNLCSLDDLRNLLLREESIATEFIIFNTKFLVFVLF